MEKTPSCKTCGHTILQRFHIRFQIDRGGGGGGGAHNWEGFKLWEMRLMTGGGWGLMTETEGLYVH